MVPLNVVFYYILKHHTSKLEYIDKMTDKFEQFTIRTQIITKSKETTTNVSRNQNYVSSRTSHKYIVSVRAEFGGSIEIYSKDLYMSAREGEYIDVLIKRKVDKNGELLDASYIPLLNTIREQI